MFCLIKPPRLIRVWEWRCNSTKFLTFPLIGGGFSVTFRPPYFDEKLSRYLFVSRLGEVGESQLLWTLWESEKKNVYIFREFILSLRKSLRHSVRIMVCCTINLSFYVIMKKGWQYKFYCFPNFSITWLVRGSRETSVDTVARLRAGRLGMNLDGLLDALNLLFNGHGLKSGQSLKLTTVT
jgi:hypothetical protein